MQDLRPVANEQAKKDTNEAALRKLTDEEAKDEKRVTRDELLSSAQKDLQPRLREGLIKQEF